MGQTVETHHKVVLGGSGPYGAFGPIDKGMGTPNISVASGTGPYGAFDRFGFRGGFSSDVVADKEKCLLVATVCPLDIRR
jgi:hypothetical protein